MNGKKNSGDNYLGLIFIVGGAFLLIWGLSHFLFPIAATIGGAILINYGLRLRSMPPLSYWARYWFLRMK